MTTAATQPEAVSNAKVRASVITWFEIPATDLERAISFYENSLAIRMHREPAWPGMAIFPYENERPDTSGCIVAAKDSPPVDGGVTIYLNCDGKIDAVLGRVTSSSGAVLEPKNHIPGVGWVAQIRDSEGNRVGLHAVV
ncbi:MAG TPA: VOC family protein [Silvibacterium sp.]|jgi:predicted enzyme related to lactoylglutathione lyase|nr:VOC family protein [Silvibacterium sp.]